MKRSFLWTVIAAALLALVFPILAAASQDNWRIVLRADDGRGCSPSPGVQAGVYPGAADGYEVHNDGWPYMALFADTPGTAMHAAAEFTEVGELFMKNIQSPTMPSPIKTWDLYIAANVNSSASVIRPTASTYGANCLPPSGFDGIAVKYSLVLLDNKGMLEAPASGTTWDLPVPTSHNPGVPYWICPDNLPVITISERTNTALAAEGYKFRFIQEADPNGSPDPYPDPDPVPPPDPGPVPQPNPDPMPQPYPDPVVTPELPSVVLALGSGLFGLASYAIRRRKA